MVASTDPGWLHTVFYTLTGLFKRVGLMTNVKKNWGWYATHAVRLG